MKLRAVCLVSAAAAFLMVARGEAQTVASWAQAVNVTAADGSLTKSGGCDGCGDAGAHSNAQLSGDGYAEFVPGANQRLYAGLGTDLTASTDAAGIDFAFSFWPGGTWDIRERGAYRTEGGYAAGDRFRVAVAGGVVTYLKNGVVVYTSTLTASYPLALDVTMFTAGGTLTGATVVSSTTTPPPPPPPPPPSTPVPPYDAIVDRVARPKPALPAFGPAGSSVVDPTFGSTITRITDALTRPGLPNRSFRTPSNSHQNMWSARGTYFYLTSTDGASLLFTFDPSTGKAQRLHPTADGDGGATIASYIEPQFSHVRDNIVYGSLNTPGSSLRTIDQLDLSTGTYSRLLDVDALVPGLAGTYLAGVGSSSGPIERVLTFFGGTSQDRHHYVVVFNAANPQDRVLLDSLASTVNGVPLAQTLNFKLHHAGIDRSGRYVMLYPTNADRQAPRNASPSYVWDLQTNGITELPSILARSNGHDAYGFGTYTNQDCCESTKLWDGAAWQFRSLATPLVTRDLIFNLLRPEEAFIADHPSWTNAQPDRLMPVINGLYRYGGTTNTAPWRAWDDEIIAIQTDAAAGVDATIWRFAHHRSNVSSDTDPNWISFWYTPRPNVSPDGRWVLFTSNWEKTLGTDPFGGDPSGTFREDVFLLSLKLIEPAQPPPPPPPPAPPVAITPIVMPAARVTVDYYATLTASGGGGQYTWTASGLPSGLTLNPSTGKITGTPQTAGTFTVLVTATDAANAANADSESYAMTVTPAVQITTTSLANAKRRTSYSRNLTAINIEGAARWRLVSGALPVGLSIDPATGTISGVPTQSGTWTFSVRIDDVNTNDTRVLSILVLK